MNLCSGFHVDKTFCSNEAQLVFEREKGYKISIKKTLRNKKETQKSRGKIEQTGVNKNT